jgi:hypothetical protein
MSYPVHNITADTAQKETVPLFAVFICCHANTLVCEIVTLNCCCIAAALAVVAYQRFYMPQYYYYSILGDWSFEINRK